MPVVKLVHKTISFAKKNNAIPSQKLILEWLTCGSELVTYDLFRIRNSELGLGTGLKRLETYTKYFNFRLNLYTVMFLVYIFLTPKQTSTVRESPCNVDEVVTCVCPLLST